MNFTLWIQSAPDYAFVTIKNCEIAEDTARRLRSLGLTVTVLEGYIYA